ncbi:uncharacterized protein EI97DRAFT_426208 [Westerdykella ornata]|uniref:Zn(2)-C6 fungal-type domain-containing protein n=1 Tax=Westerdykella ornata TaxID=318751 RepID=A0A6A6JBC5_WESOR|nr:uncharacterized protein EI97DRAFT_426208 [Westerdykella ornata]KAF2272499.1 hypothetical protein EI97DRAFT_426208 [Westerdykella ornata]
MTTPRRKACVECRQQKIKCDVEQHRVPHDPCSRCKKMNIDCRILPTSTRNLRQTKAEMRRELEQLKWGLRQSQELGSMQPTTPTSAMAAMHPAVDSHQVSPVMEPGSTAFSTASARPASMSMSPNFPGPTSRPGTSGGPPSALGTHPRILEDYVVDAKKIDDTFTMFFQQYHHYFPVLDNTLSPNDYYELSPFLFWSIVVTGSRRYAEDPMILDRISQLITPLAFSSMALRSTPIPVIEGLIILCMWPLPTNSLFKDVTHVLCGAALHLATQIGLHVSGVGQDFARTPLKKNQELKIFRAALWMHCMITYVRSCCAEGIPPFELVTAQPTDGDQRDQEEQLKLLPEDLIFLHKTHITLLRALTAMARLNLKHAKSDAASLRSLISIFDGQLYSLAPSSPSDLCTLGLDCARIHVLAFHFFANPATPDVEALVRLYALCLELAQTVTDLSRTTDLTATCPSFFDRTITLTGFIILKLVRSQLAHHLDLQAGERAYFQCVNFCKAMSLQPNDISVRISAIMTNLWGSTRIFRRRDGRIESLGLRLRTRLSMSVSFDMFWYWRGEFGNMLNPYSDEARGSISVSVGGIDDNSSIPSTGGPQPETPKFENREVNVPAGAVALKASQPFQPNLGTPMSGVSLDTSLEGYDSSNPPMLDQFLDYDWATNFDFSNDWTNNPHVNPGLRPGVTSAASAVGPVPQVQPDAPPVGYTEMGVS